MILRNILILGLIPYMYSSVGIRLLATLCGAVFEYVSKLQLGKNAVVTAFVCCAL